MGDEGHGVCLSWHAPHRPFPAVGSTGSAGSSARHLVSGACSEAPAPELPAPGHSCSFADPIAANLEGAVTFEAPDLPEETLMEVRAGVSKGFHSGWSGCGVSGGAHPSCPVYSKGGDPALPPQGIISESQGRQASSQPGQHVLP